MYCPHCAQPNADDVKYCRGCGEDLIVISRAMSKSLPVMLAGRLDAHIARKNERLRRDGILTGASALFLLFSGIFQLAANPAAWLTAAMMLAGGFLLLLASAWDLAAYKRSISPEFRNSAAAATKREELAAPHLEPQPLTGTVPEDKPV